MLVLYKRNHSIPGCSSVKKTGTHLSVFGKAQVFDDASSMASNHRVCRMC